VRSAVEEILAGIREELRSRAAEKMTPADRARVLARR
jgi:hypothetical protein